MSKRWFDLIFSIIFAVFFVATGGGMDSGLYGFFLDTELLSIYIGYIVIVFALRRFFYGSKSP